MILVRVRPAVARLLLVFAALLPLQAAAQGDQRADTQVLLGEAKRYFDALDYEHAVAALDRIVVTIEARPPQDPLHQRLAEAYEMRGRSRFALGDQPGARADFVSLLKTDPAYALPSDVSPRVVALFQDAAKATVTQLKLSVTPPTAEVRLDGTLISANATVPIAIGEHVIAAKQIGYRPITQAVTVEIDKPADATIALERVSAVIAIVTAPADVEVIVDGVSHGRTAPGPPRADFAEAAARAGVPASELSSTLIVPDVIPGAHVVQFKRDCHVTTERRVNVDKPDDYTLDPVKLERAVASLAIRSPQPGASVVIDGQPRGVTPFAAADLCEGDHIVELRSASGRFFKRVLAHTGDKVDIAGALKPAFAIVSTSGQSSTLNTDLRLLVERAFEPSQSVTLFAPPADALDQALKAQQLPAAWLAFDGSKRPVGVSADISKQMRQELSSKLARAFDAQGVASVTVPSATSRNRLVLSLLAAGSGEPDVLEIAIDSPDSIGSAVAQLDRPPSFFRPSVGLTAIDVADLTGAVVVNVDSNGPAAKTGVQTGDVIAKANGQPVNDALALTTLLTGRKAGDVITVELKDRAGAPKRADLAVFMTPKLLGLADQTLLANRLLLDIRARLQSPADPTEEAVVRLNLAAALARLENWADARQELQRIKLPDGPGVANGTVQYLLGVCADKLGMRAEAETAWKAAAQSESTLTEDGPSVKELAEARLAELQRRGRGMH